MIELGGGSFSVPSNDEPGPCKVEHRGESDEGKGDVRALPSRALREGGFGPGGGTEACRHVPPHAHRPCIAFGVASPRMRYRHKLGFLCLLPKRPPYGTHFFGPSGSDG